MPPEMYTGLYARARIRFKWANANTDMVGLT